MKSSTNKRKGWAPLIAACGVAYPFAVYLGFGRLPPGAFITMALALIGARLLMLRRQGALRLFLPVLIIAAGATAVAGVVDAAMATRLYPV